MSSLAEDFPFFAINSELSDIIRDVAAESGSSEEKVLEEAIRLRGLIHALGPRAKGFMVGWKLKVEKMDG